MDIRSLQCFRLAYESGSVGKAAKQAFLTRQGLSQVIKGLESEIRQSLFIRHQNGLEPTELAHTIYPKVVELLTTYHDVQALCNPEDIPKETIRLCIAYGVLISIPFDDMIEEIYNNYPDIRLEIDTVEPSFAKRCIAEGSEDIALVVGPVEGAQTQCVTFCTVPLYAAVHESLLPDKACRTIKSLKNLTWFGLAKDFPLDCALMDLSDREGLSLNMSFDWHDYHLILDQVSKRKGACVIPKHRIAQFCQEGVAAIPLEGPEFSWEISAIIPTDRPMSRGARTVFDWLKTRLSQL